MDDTLTKFTETIVLSDYLTPKEALSERYKHIEGTMLGYMDKVTIEDFYTHATDINKLADHMKDYSEAYDMLSSVDVTKNSAKEISSAKYAPAKDAA